MEREHFRENIQDDQTGGKSNLGRESHRKSQSVFFLDGV